MKEHKIIIPPIKSQGIKTKLIDHIINTIDWKEDERWIEPFFGTGVVAFNVKPKHALLSDKNSYIIELYKKIQSGEINKNNTKEFLEYHGEKLKNGGQTYYNRIREKFNATHDVMLFLFLNRSDFNGMIRFNRNGNFNVPYCHKDERFSKAYITKICNQIDNIYQIIKDRDWVFKCCDWKDTFNEAKKGDYIYIDPPYIGRDTSYVGEWPEDEAIKLSEFAHKTKAKVCLSMWKENVFRKNQHLWDYWNDFDWYEYKHFYHIGAKEKNRHSMIEVLAIKH